MHFTHICKPDFSPADCFSILAFIEKEDEKEVTVHRFQNYGKLDCGIVTMSKKEFKTYYEKINKEMLKNELSFLDY